MDLNKHQHCPECGTPMQVCLPIWVTPGEESIDTGNIDWDSGNRQRGDNWWCPECEGHWFPADEDETAENDHHSKGECDDPDRTDDEIIGRTYVFEYPDCFHSLPDYTAHSGRAVKVTRRLSESEADRSPDMERMFEIICVDDGWIGHAFESEIFTLAQGPAIGE